MTESTAPSPRAFLSHASEDKEAIVRPVAEELGNLGVQVWFDEWEIHPGDSLIRKLFVDGIDAAEAFVVFLSAASVDKPWVRDELDAGAVRRIEDGTRLIPVRLDDCDVPPPLRHIVHIPAQHLMPGQIASKIADAIYERSLRPTPGPTPEYVSVVPRLPGLNPADESVLRIIFELAVETGHRMIVDRAPLIRRSRDAGLSESALRESLTALAQLGYISVRVMGSPFLIQELELTQHGFWFALPALIPNAEPVVNNLKVAVVNNAEDFPTTDHAIEFLMEVTGTPRLIVDECLRKLDQQGFLTFVRTLGGSYIINIQPTLARTGT